MNTKHLISMLALALLVALVSVPAEAGDVGKERLRANDPQTATIGPYNPVKPFGHQTKDLRSYEKPVRDGGDEGVKDPVLDLDIGKSTIRDEKFSLDVSDWRHLLEKPLETVLDFIYAIDLGS